MPARTRWVYLTTAPDHVIAEMWQELLRNDGVLAIVRADIAPSHLGVGIPCRLMVPEERLAEARNLLWERLGPEALR